MKIKPADTWFSRCVRHAAKWTCERCGKQFPEGKAQGLDCSHHFGRAKRSVRWDKANAAALCMTCHREYHDYPTEGAKWLAGFLGSGMIDILREKANQIVKITKVEEKQIAAHYRSEYRRMLDDGTNDFVSWQ